MLLLNLILIVFFTKFNFYNKIETVSAKFIEHPEFRIVNGNNASPGQFKHAVSVQSKKRHFCGGSIIKPNWILTAGHCGSYVLETNLTMVQVMIGSVTLNPSGDYYDVDKIIIHEYYEEIRDQVYVNDVALLKLKSDIKFDSDTIDSIPIAKSIPKPGSIARVSGWGLNGNKTIPNHLQYLDEKLITKMECIDLNYAVSSLDKQFCTETTDEQGVCDGDSGAALVYKGQQIGIVSWGLRCAFGLPDVYAEVSRYREWILNKIAISS